MAFFLLLLIVLSFLFFGFHLVIPVPFFLELRVYRNTSHKVRQKSVHISPSPDLTHTRVAELVKTDESWKMLEVHHVPPNVKVKRGTDFWKLCPLSAEERKSFRCRTAFFIKHRRTA